MQLETSERLTSRPERLYPREITSIPIEWVAVWTAEPFCTVSKEIKIVFILPPAWLRTPKPSSFIASRYTDHATSDSYTSNHLLVQQSGMCMKLHKFQSAVKHSSNLYNSLFPGLKRPGCEVDHPSPSSAEVNERVQLYLYSPSGPSWPVLG